MEMLIKIQTKKKNLTTSKYKNEFSKIKKIINSVKEDISLRERTEKALKILKIEQKTKELLPIMPQDERDILDMPWDIREQYIKLRLKKILKHFSKDGKIENFDLGKKKYNAFTY